MKWVDYREKLGIGFSDIQKSSILANKISNYLQYDNEVAGYSKRDYYEFCSMTGSKYTHHPEPRQLVANRIEVGLDSTEMIIAYYIAFVNSLTSCSNIRKKHFVEVLGGFLEEVGIPYEVIWDDDGAFIFPKGVAEFDDALVSEPLAWLRKYPAAEKAWIKALRAYSENSVQNASDVADLFRKALEAFFQEFFHGQKALEKYIADYGTYLKQKGIPKEITNNYEKLLDTYTKYMNNYAKHRDATSDKVLEYLMYQTGSIMRLLITLEAEVSENAD